MTHPRGELVEGICSPGCLALSTLEQTLQFQLHIVLVQQVVPQGAFVVYSNLQSVVHKRLILFLQGLTFSLYDVFCSSLPNHNDT